MAALEGDYAIALREWQPLAEQDYAKAHYNIRIIDYDDRDVSQYYKEAVKWCR